MLLCDRGFGSWGKWGKMVGHGGGGDVVIMYYERVFESTQSINYEERSRNAAKGHPRAAREIDDDEGNGHKFAIHRGQCGRISS